MIGFSEMDATPEPMLANVDASDFQGFLGDIYGVDVSARERHCTCDGDAT